jgi:hypothetical protein
MGGKRCGEGSDHLLRGGIHHGQVHRGRPAHPGPALRDDEESKGAAAHEEAAPTHQKTCGTKVCSCIGGRT